MRNLFLPLGCLCLLLIVLSPVIVPGSNIVPIVLILMAILFFGLDIKFNDHD